MTVKILIGDCRERLEELPGESVHCVVCSPPYWGLRDYGVAGQLGLEPTFTEFIDKMVEVFREVRRVLRPDGTLWLNLGDSYAGGGGFSPNAPSNLAGSKQTTSGGSKPGGIPVRDGLKPKDLCGIPWRLAFALQADGWWLRQDIIWSKPNPMPESVTDRCTKAHEYLFLLSKSARYFYDADAIREEPARNDPRVGRSSHALVDVSPNPRKGMRSSDPERFGLTRGTTNQPCSHPNGRNKRSVWEIATAPFPEAHFATFPPALVEPCIKAGTSEKGCCGKCGAPWVRITETNYRKHENWFGNKQDARHSRGKAGTSYNEPIGTRTTGWSPTCACQAPVIPCTVLDHFGGAGTTGLVADRLQRNAILIELNPTYADMAQRRIAADAPLFTQPEAAE